MRQKITKAVIPAAGFGTRFLPATKAIPKEMIPIIDRPMIQYIVEECVNAGIKDIILITARGKSAVEDHFDYSFEVESLLKEKSKKDLLKVTLEASEMANVISVRQKQALGLGHAVLAAKAVVGNEPFAVLLGDDLIDSKVPCIKQLIDIYEEHDTSVIGVMEVPKKETQKYGIIGIERSESEKLHVVNRMVEKPKPEDAPSQLACPGRYVLDPHIFKLLEETKPGAGGEIQLTDALARLCKDKGLMAYQFDGIRHDTGDKLGFIEATIAFALKRPDLADGTRRLLEKYGSK
ncbi:MAG: UTP--glucose-1-phosphate uridylyltransferase GalU [Bacteriovoracia bacterium]